jgi:hypothetical protein
LDGSSLSTVFQYSASFFIPGEFADGFGKSVNT